MDDRGMVENLLREVPESDVVEATYRILDEEEK